MPTPVIYTRGVTVAKGAGGLSFGIFRKLYISVIIIFLISILTNAMIISYNEKSIEPGIKYIGDKFSKPTLNIQEQSNLILENKNIFFNQYNNIFKNIWYDIKIYSSIIGSLIVILLWLKILTFIVTNYIIWDNSKKAVGQVIALGIFLAVQMILGAMDGTSIMMPFYAFRDLGKALLYVIPSLAKLGELFTK